MDKIVYNLVFNRKKNLNEKGTAVVQVEAYLNKKRKYFSTKVYLTPAQWDNRKQIVKNHPNAEALNHMLSEYISIIERKELDLWLQNKTADLNVLKSALLDQTEDNSFLTFLESEIINSSLKESTKKNHFSTLKVLSAFKKSISFSDLTFEFISSFDLYLRENDYHVNTIAKHMKHLKRYINIAINKERIDIQRYAFRKYKIKSIESQHTHLSPGELAEIEALKLKGKYSCLQKIVDAFLFCCYTGLRYSDFCNLVVSNVVMINNETWLIYRSVKTKIEVRLPLYLLFDGKAMDILRKYSDNPDEFFKLKDNSNVNKRLIRVAQLAGITKHISFHVARHTNATLLIYSGVNITTVQKLLGHRSVKTTQVYTNIMDMTVIRDLERCGSISTLQT